MAGRQLTATTARAIVRYIERDPQNQSIARRIAAYLVESRSVKDTAIILRTVETMRRKKGIAEAQVTTARPLSADQRSHIERVVRKYVPEATTVTIVEHVVPEVIGGITVHVAGKELSASVREKLNRLKHAV
jgi:F0F1-type ATP synthase delta subunit